MHLLNFAWPGNVRQLMNVVRRAASIAGDSRTVTQRTVWKSLEVEKQLAAWRSRGGGSVDWGSKEPKFLTYAEAMSRHLDKALAMTKGNVTKAAELLGLPRSTLQSKLRKRSNSA